MKTNRAERFMTLLAESQNEPVLVAAGRVSGFLSVWLDADDKQAQAMSEALAQWVSELAQQGGRK